MMHYLLFYETAPDYLEKRGNYRDQHLQLAWDSYEKGELVLGGALKDRADGAVLLFKGDSPEAATRFAENDPYVKNGLVKNWEVRAWHTVVGDDPAEVVRPAEH